MKVRIVFCLLALLASFTVACKKGDEALSSGETGESALPWHTYNEGTQLAKQEGKDIMLDFYASWCQWCRVMDREIFSDSEMAGRIRKGFVPVRINTDRLGGTVRFKGEDYSVQQFSMMLGVRGLPTVVFLDKNENIITIIPGYIKKGMFSSIIEYIQLKCYEKKVDINNFIEGKASCR